MKKKLASEQRKTKKQDKQLIAAKAEMEKEKEKNLNLERALTKTTENYYYFKNEYLAVVSLSPQAFADRVGEPNDKMHD